jgi:hypothetical protein
LPVSPARPPMLVLQILIKVLLINISFYKRSKKLAEILCPVSYLKSIMDLRLINSRD